MKVRLFYKTFVDRKRQLAIEGSSHSSVCSVTWLPITLPLCKWDSLSMDKAKCLVGDGLENTVLLGDPRLAWLLRLAFESDTLPLRHERPILLLGSIREETEVPSEEFLRGCVEQVDPSGGDISAFESKIKERKTNFFCRNCQICPKRIQVWCIIKWVIIENIFVISLLPSNVSLYTNENSNITNSKQYICFPNLFIYSIK